MICEIASNEEFPTELKKIKWRAFLEDRYYDDQNDDNQRL